jgi:hypothetical protein
VATAHKKNTDAPPPEGSEVVRALVSELLVLDAGEPSPSEIELAAATELLCLGDLSPPVLFDSSTMKLVRGRVLVMAAAHDGRREVAAVDLGEWPALERGYVGAWDTLAPLLASRETFARVLERLEAGAAEGLSPRLWRAT